MPVSESFYDVNCQGINTQADIRICLHVCRYVCIRNMYIVRHHLANIIYCGPLTLDSQPRVPHKYPHSA